jgi:hypothetical protein
VTGDLREELFLWMMVRGGQALRDEYGTRCERVEEAVKETLERERRATLPVSSL